MRLSISLGVWQLQALVGRVRLLDGHGLLFDIAVFSLVLVKESVQFRKVNLQRVCRDGNRTAAHFVIGLIEFPFHCVSLVDIFFGLSHHNDQHLLLWYLEDPGTDHFGPWNKPGRDSAGVVNNSGVGKYQTRFFVE